MHQFSAQPARVTGPHTPSFVETLQGGHRLLVARACWIMLTLLLLTLNVVILPRYDALLQARCQKGTPCLASPDLALAPPDRIAPWSTIPSSRRVQSGIPIWERQMSLLQTRR